MLWLFEGSILWLWAASFSVEIYWHFNKVWDPATWLSRARWGLSHEGSTFYTGGTRLASTFYEGHWVGRASEMRKENKEIKKNAIMSCFVTAGGDSRCNNTIHRPVHTCGEPDRGQGGDDESLRSSGIAGSDFKRIRLHWKMPWIKLESHFVNSHLSGLKTKNSQSGIIAFLEIQLKSIPQTDWVVMVTKKDRSL